MKIKETLEHFDHITKNILKKKVRFIEYSCQKHVNQSVFFDHMVENFKRQHVETREKCGAGKMDSVVLNKINDSKYVIVVSPLSMSEICQRWTYELCN